MRNATDKPRFRRRLSVWWTTLVTAVALCLVGAEGAVAQVAGTPHRLGYSYAQFQRDLQAITATGVTGVLGEVTLAGHRMIGAHGVADIVTRRPVNPYGYFRIGSTTKTLVSVVLLQLAEEGRISLEDSVEEWLPGMVSGNGYDGAAITIRHLLQHTSGIHNYTETEQMTDQLGSVEGYYRTRFNSVTPEELVALGLSEPPDFPPGTGWHYSNTNFVLAGLIIERVTGRSWSQEVRTRILQPLGMRHTFDPGTRPGLPHPHARGYQQFTEDGPLVDTTLGNYSWAHAAGALISTAGDLGRFWRALERGELLGPVGMAQLHDTVLADDPELQQVMPGARYGLGIIWQPLSCGGGYWEHGGDTLGYATVTGVSEDGRHSVVLSLSTQLISFDAHLAAMRLVDRALCAAQRR